mgnify:CR=1 FL=1
MQPADLATIRDALATVRELSVYDRECTDAEWASINIASRLLARELVRLIDAGEAVRKVVCAVVCAACGGDGYGYDPSEREIWGAQPCDRCEGQGDTLEPLFAVEEPCPTCHGRRKVYEQSETGQDYGEWPCPTCYPEGKEVGK